MKKLLIALGLTGLLSLGGLAVATGGAATPSVSLGACLDGWYVNSDEVARKPTPTAAGLKFENNQLVHHATMISVASLTPGTYAAIPAPSQPSFFSVEVRNPSGAYGTLRWNPATSKWSITIGASAPGAPIVATHGTFEDASPVALLAGKVTKWGAFNPATDLVVTFGVGYTNSPGDGAATVVSAVTFGGTTYNLKCASSSSSTSASASASSSSSSQPAASSSSSASASPSSSSQSPTTSASASTSSTPAPIFNAGNRLPTTGAAVPITIGVGLLLLVGGAALWYFSKRRNDEFEAV